MTTCKYCGIEHRKSYIDPYNNEFCSMKCLHNWAIEPKKDITIETNFVTFTDGKDITLEKQNAIN